MAVDFNESAAFEIEHKEVSSREKIKNSKIGWSIMYYSKEESKYSLLAIIRDDHSLDNPGKSKISVKTLGTEITGKTSCSYQYNTSPRMINRESTVT